MCTAAVCAGARAIDSSNGEITEAREENERTHWRLFEDCEVSRFILLFHLCFFVFFSKAKQALSSGFADFVKTEREVEVFESLERAERIAIPKRLKVKVVMCSF